MRYRHWWERHEKLIAKTAFFEAILYSHLQKFKAPWSEPRFKEGWEPLPYTFLFLKWNDKALLFSYYD